MREMRYTRVRSSQFEQIFCISGLKTKPPTLLEASILIMVNVLVNWKSSFYGLDINMKLKKVPCMILS